jgi:hypothetical protein
MTGDRGLGSAFAFPLPVVGQFWKAWPVAPHFEQRLGCILIDETLGSDLGWQEGESRLNRVVRGLVSKESVV